MTCSVTATATATALVFASSTSLSTAASRLPSKIQYWLHIFPWPTQQRLFRSSPSPPSPPPYPCRSPHPGSPADRPPSPQAHPFVWAPPPLLPPHQEQLAPPRQHQGCAHQSHPPRCPRHSRSRPPSPHQQHGHSRQQCPLPQPQAQ